MAMGIMRDLGRGSVVSGRPWLLCSSYWDAHRFCKRLLRTRIPAQETLSNHVLPNLEFLQHIPPHKARLCAIPGSPFAAFAVRRTTRIIVCRPRPRMNRSPFPVRRSAMEFI